MQTSVNEYLTSSLCPESQQSCYSICMYKKKTLNCLLMVNVVFFECHSNGMSYEYNIIPGCEWESFLRH